MSRVGISYFLICTYNNIHYNASELLDMLKGIWNECSTYIPSNLNSHLFSDKDNISPSLIISYEQLMLGNATNTLFDNYRDEIVSYDTKNTKIIEYWDNILN